MVPLRRLISSVLMLSLLPGVVRYSPEGSVPIAPERPRAGPVVTEGHCFALKVGIVEKSGQYRNAVASGERTGINILGNNVVGE